MSELKTEKIIEMVKSKGYIFLERTKDDFRNIIIFSDNEGYKYQTQWENFKKSKNFKQITYSNPFSIENAKLYLKSNFPNVELISSEIKDVTEQLEFKCTNCDNSFYCTWAKLKWRKYHLCEYCLKNIEGIYKNKKDIESVKKSFSNIGLTLQDESQYKGIDKNMDCYDNEGYKYSVRYGNTLSGKIPNKTHKTNPYSIENINHYLKIKNSSTKCISKKYIKEDELLNFICGECNNKFSRTWANMSLSIHLCCEKCQIIKRGENNRIKIDEVIEGFNRMNLKLLDFNYCGNNKRLLCEDQFGYRGYVPYNSQRKIASSSRTGFDYFSLKNNYSNFIYNANNFCKLNNYDCEILNIEEQQIYTTPTIKCKCGCGKEFITSINSFKSGKRMCDKCSRIISKYEQMTIDYLIDNNVDFIRQKIFKDCRNILPLPFDFYIKDKNILIEIDGQGHYQICYFNRCSKEQGEKSLKMTRANDKIKNNYCKEKGIKLIRIPYWDMDNKNYINILNQSILNLAD